MRVVLVGGGGHASDVLGVFEAVYGPCSDGNNPVIGYVDDDDLDNRRFNGRGISQLGHIDDISTLGATHYVLATGFPKARKKLLDRISGSQLEPATVVHPRANIPDHIPIGKGTVILGGVCVSPLARIGDHVYVSHGALLGHDCDLQDFVSVMPGAAVSGDTILGGGSMIGTNATILQGVNIGRDAVIGAGAVVLKDVPDFATAIGVPARNFVSS